jgi:hypothetical protein
MPTEEYTPISSCYVGFMVLDCADALCSINISRWRETRRASPKDTKKNNVWYSTTKCEGNVRLQIATDKKGSF